MCCVIPSSNFLPSSLLQWGFAFLFPWLWISFQLHQRLSGLYSCVSLLRPLTHAIPLLFYTVSSTSSSCLPLWSSCYFLFPLFIYGLKYTWMNSYCGKNPVSHPAVPGFCSRAQQWTSGGKPLACSVRMVPFWRKWIICQLRRRPPLCLCQCPPLVL